MALPRDLAPSRFPHVFADGHGRTLRVTTLDDARAAGLVRMYLDWPRDSFQGLPPLRDEICVQWAETMVLRGINLVALAADEEVVGHVALFPMNYARCEIFLAVRSDQQHSGIGTELLRCGLQLARDRGIDAVWLDVEAANVHARRLFHKFGFHDLAADPKDEFEMVLDLSAGPGEAPADPRACDRETAAGV